MSVDGCPGKQSNCFVFGLPRGTHSFLNVNGPLQVGGMSFNPKELQSAMKWDYLPTTTKFTGCISNLSLNGEVIYIFMNHDFLLAVKTCIVNIKYSFSTVL